MTVAKVIVDISTSAVDKIFDYLIPHDMPLQIGDRVNVPFGSKIIEGYVIDIATQDESKYKLKYISARLDAEPIITTEMLELMHYMRTAFYLRYVDCLRLFLPSKLRGGKIKELTREFVSVNKAIPIDEMLQSVGNRAKSQKKLLENIGDGDFLTNLNADYGASAVKSLIEKGFLLKTSERVMRKPFNDIKSESEKSVELTEEQKKAVEIIENTDKRTILLHGVTGSGKTEVYLTLIDHAVKQGKTAIMLVPEISLTPQMLRIFRSRYGESVALLHSGLSAGERFDEWQRIYSGDANVVLGARSAIFSPLKNVGIIILDEEHDQSYVSDNNPRFNAIDVAIWRGEYNGAHVVLGSATPSLESYNNASKGKYALASMTKRITDKGLPTISVVDMAREIMDGNSGTFSRELKADLVSEINNGNQVIIFLNRRGFASFQMCKQCGYVAKCTDCDIALTYHTEDKMLKCHYCGKRYKPLTHCPNCGSEHIRYGKAGTEKVVDEVKKLLPNVKVLRLDNDTTRTKTAYHEILGAFRRGDAQVLVGTQMVAKGHDFPNVTLVGILDADMSLYYSSYMSNERTFQLLTQVSGRAGRAEKQGKVIVQTYTPNHFIFKLIKQNNYKSFFDKEVNTREISKFPPFTTIVRILVRSEDEMKTVEQTKKIFEGIKALKQDFDNEFVYCAAMKAPVARIEKLYRYQIIIRLLRDKQDVIIDAIYSIVDKSQSNDISVFVELNPNDMR